VAAELDALGPNTPGLDPVRPRRRLPRTQAQRFGDLLARNATRPLPQFEAIADWLATNLPQTTEVTLVHGDLRLGNGDVRAPSAHRASSPCSTGSWRPAAPRWPTWAT
jgi:hypothetical protein